MAKYILNSKQWKIIFSILLTIKGIYVKPKRKTRRFIEAVFCMTKGGFRWRSLDRWYGHWRAIHKRFLDWTKRGVLDTLFSAITRNFNHEFIMIDSTSVKAHPCASGSRASNNEARGLGRSRGGFTTKIHMAINGLGLPLKLLISPGQHSDIDYAEPLLREFAPRYVLGDKGYDCDAFIQKLSTKKCTVVIPGRCNRIQFRPYDRTIYKQRNKIERFFRLLKNYRRVFSRFDKSPEVYTTFAICASILIVLKQKVHTI